VSREVIRDIVVPIVARILHDDGYFTPYRTFVLADENLEQFLEEEMRRQFSVIGANGCQHLKEQLEEAKKNDPYEFEYLLRQLVQKYVKLQIKIRQAKKRQNDLSGPPDRFQPQRRKSSVLFQPQQDQ
jgi:hypothetical protein